MVNVMGKMIIRMLNDRGDYVYVGEDQIFVTTDFYRPCSEHNNNEVLSSEIVVMHDRIKHVVKSLDCYDIERTLYEEEREFTPEEFKALFKLVSEKLKGDKPDDKIINEIYADIVIFVYEDVANTVLEFVDIPKT